MDAAAIEAMFTKSDGSFLCARWGRPVAPVVFGLADESLGIFRGALRAGYAHARHPMAETDPEMGANLMLFFVRAWAELAGVPDLDRLTGVPGLPERLAREGADHYRLFRFDPESGIRACLMFLNMGGALGGAHPGGLAERVAMQSMLTFAGEIAPSAALAGVIRAAYDPVLPVATTQPAHALRLAARLAA
ncbi:hypothetical protein E4L95_18295 [Paracoccus liaowanqingii]|uniref:Uncharacterized protein n=1 Tax=Paracoccus liaowanqingii TaxID=2560053 RepID=A0A4Z1CKB4_9RHOB|nr:hypothetical protein [Paracoccus liaowanqingii]TGN49402.1 hypothetical protein E4L95_18295 [Paracoccus liaowanqingii]